MNYPVNTKPRLSAVAIASGVLFALAALVTIIMSLINGSFASMNFIYKGLFALGIVAFIAVAVLIFARAKEVFLAVPFGILAFRSLIHFVTFVVSFPIVDYFRWFGAAEGLLYYVPNVLIYILTLASFILFTVTCVTRKNRKALGITAGIIYAAQTVFSWLIFPIINSKMYGYSVNFRYITRMILPNIRAYIDEILVAIAMILLGVALSKLAPSIPKYAPNAYAQRPPMPNGYAPNGYVPNGYAPGGYAQRPPVQNNYGYAPMQNGGYAPMQNPVNTQAPTAQPLQNNYQNSVPAQVSNDNSAPQVPAENVAPSVDEAAVENTSAPQTDTDKLASELSAYKKMLDDGLITESDFEAKKKQILGL